jgi:peptidoglycan hydrolase-like protein with peptidoglycan-binding domain
MEFAMIGTGQGARPVPKKLRDELDALGFGRDVVLTSCLRTQAAVDFARARGARLSSQAELFDGWQRRLPGFNPANPPGQSTHECRNDGVAFPGPARLPLRYWQVGVDCLFQGGSGVATVRARASARGWTFTLTYPGNPREAHHGNFRREPILFRPLKRGSRGPRVAAFTRRLAYLKFLPERTGGFGDKVEDALKAFQRRYELVDDGVYGAQTARQLATAVRSKKACRRAARALPAGPGRDAALARCHKRFGPR